MLRQKQALKLLNKEIKSIHKKGGEPKKFKLFLYIKNIKIKIQNRFKHFTNKLRLFYTSEKAVDFKEIIITIVGYGVAGMFALITFFGYEFRWYYLIGAGCGIYLMMDFMDFLTKKTVEVLRTK